MSTLTNGEAVLTESVYQFMVGMVYGIKTDKSSFCDVMAQMILVRSIEIHNRRDIFTKNELRQLEDNLKIIH